jgi:hypothetical protein
MDPGEAFSLEPPHAASAIARSTSRDAFVIERSDVIEDLLISS